MIVLFLLNFFAGLFAGNTAYIFSGNIIGASYLGLAVFTILESIWFIAQYVVREIKK